MKPQSSRPTINNSTILVTGGAGFIGSNLIDRLINENAKEVIVVDNLFNGNEDNLKKAITKGAIFYKDDIEISSSLDYIFENHKIDIVFNCATKCLNYSFINPKNSYDTNVNGILNILEHQRKGHFKTLVHFSTSEAYGTAVYEPMDEKHPINPTTAYAAGKAAADIALCTWVKMFNIDAFIFRPFNNYGFRQQYKGYLAGIIPNTVSRIMNGDSPEIHGEGNQTRDFIFVEDTLEAVTKLYPLMKSAESINISTGGQISIREVIHKICSLMNYQGKILYKSARVADVQKHNSNNNKMKSMIKYQFTDFDQGLAKTIQWYKDNINDYK